MHTTTRHPGAVCEIDSKRSTARDDAPNADKRSFFDGDPGDRVAVVPFNVRPTVAGNRVTATVARDPSAPSGYGGGASESRGATGRTMRLPTRRLASRRASRFGRSRTRMSRLASSCDETRTTCEGVGAPGTSRDQR